MTYSPGYAVPIWLGRGQARLWRRLDRIIGGHTFTTTTVRALAAELGVNPGSVSRDLDRLAALGLAVHDASWGRRGVRLWRVVARGGRRGFDARRRARALARIGVASAGQLALFDVDSPPGPGGSTPADGAAPPAPSAAPSTSGASRRRLHDSAGAPDSPAVDSPAGGPFGTVRCSCGRVRLTRGEALPESCAHPPDPVASPDAMPTVDATPAQSVPCLDYQAHRFRHVYQGGTWRCEVCAP